MALHTQSTDSKKYAGKGSWVIDQMHRRKHIDDMTNKWLSQTPNPPRENTQTYTGR